MFKWLNRGKPTPLAQPAAAPAVPPPPAPVGAAPATPIVSARRAQLRVAPIHPVAKADELLGELPRWREIEDRIYKASQVDRPLFDKVYLGAIKAFAERVQWLPASESDHHSEPLGQLEHTLEAVLNAMVHRRSLLLPIGAEPERQAREGLVWTYAIFVAALCHDAGRPAARFNIRARRGTERWVHYSPMGDSLVELRMTEYQASWDDRMPYAFHQQLSLAALALLIPAAGRAWLQQAPEALAQVAAFLYGDKYNCGIIGEIAYQADAKSAQHYKGLKSPGGMAIAGRPRLSLQERALTALRQLAADWTINGKSARSDAKREGSDAWVKGDYLFVKATVMEDLHARLLAESDEGVPSEATTLVTKLQDHGLCLCFTDDKGSARAVFKISIATSAGKVVANDFTVLIFPVDRLFELGRRPSQYDGTITVVRPALPPGHVLLGSSAPAGAPMPAPPAGASGAPSNSASPPAKQPVSTAQESPPAAPATIPPHDPELEAAASPTSVAPAAAVPAQLSPTADSAREFFSSMFGGESSAESTSPSPSAPETAALSDDVDVPSPPANSSPPEKAVLAPATQAVVGTELAHINEHADFIPVDHRSSRPAAVLAFFAWLRSGLTATPDNGGGFVIKYNATGALIHGVNDVPAGLGIVTPIAFETFCKRGQYHLDEGDAKILGDVNAEGQRPTREHMQHLFRKSMWAVYSGERPSENVFQYLVAAGKNKDTPKDMTLAIAANGAAELILPPGLRADANPLLSRNSGPEARARWEKRAADRRVNEQRTKLAQEAKAGAPRLVDAGRTVATEPATKSKSAPKMGLKADPLAN